MGWHRPVSPSPHLYRFLQPEVRGTSLPGPGTLGGESGVGLGPLAAQGTSAAEMSLLGVGQPIPCVGPSCQSQGGFLCVFSGVGPVQLDLRGFSGGEGGSCSFIVILMCSWEEVSAPCTRSATLSLRHTLNDHRHYVQSCKTICPPQPPPRRQLHTPMRSLACYLDF